MTDEDKTTTEPTQPPREERDTQLILGCPQCGLGPLTFCEVGLQAGEPEPLLCSHCAGLAILERTTGKPIPLPWHLMASLGEEDLDVLVEEAYLLRSRRPDFWHPLDGEPDVLKPIREYIDTLPAEIRGNILRQIIRADWIFAASVRTETPEGMASAVAIAVSSHYLAQEHGVFVWDLMRATCEKGHHA